MIIGYTKNVIPKKKINCDSLLLIVVFIFDSENRAIISIGVTYRRLTKTEFPIEKNPPIIPEKNKILANRIILFIIILQY